MQTLIFMFYRQDICFKLRSKCLLINFYKFFVLMEVSRNATLLNKMRTQQQQFIRHVLRRHSLEHLVTTSKIEGKRARGRQREKILDGIARWLRESKTIHIPKDVADRELWQRMISNANWQGTLRRRILLCFSVLLARPIRTVSGNAV